MNIDEAMKYSKMKDRLLLHVPRTPLCYLQKKPAHFCSTCDQVQSGLSSLCSENSEDIALLRLLTDKHQEFSWLTVMRQMI